MTPTIEDYATRILAHIDITPDGCWRWTGHLSPVWGSGVLYPSGYGQVGRNLLVHRVVWEHLRGPIPPGMTLDHECHNRSDCNLGRQCPHRRCVNPDDIQMVPMSVNALSGRTPSALNAAKTHCLKGHEYTESNTYYRPSRWGRYCRICQADSNARCRANAEYRAAAVERSRAWRAARSAA